MGMSVGVLDHYNVSTRKLDETVRFYQDVLGLVNGPRPPSSAGRARLLWRRRADAPPRPEISR